MILTEQWKKGELERGRYYIKYRGNYMSDNWHGDCWEDSWSDYVEEVLAPVPSYEEWQKLKLHDEKATIKLGEVCIENLKLKELLKECRGLLDNYNHTFETKDWEKSSNLITKITNAIGEKK